MKIHNLLILSIKSKYYRNFIFAAGCLLLTLTLLSNNTLASATIDGYWEITAEFENYDLYSTVRFKTGLDKTVEGITLGPTDGRDGSFLGKMSGDRFLLKTLGPQGEMQVSLTVTDNKLFGTWSANNKEGKITGIRIKSKGNDSKYYSQYLKIVLSTINSLFYDPKFNGIDLEKLKLKYTTQLNGIKDDADFVQLMRRMLAEFKVSHLDFYLSPKGIPIKPKTPQISWKKLSNQTGYLNLRSFETFSPLDSVNYYLALEKAFSELNSLPTLIVDLRDNSGGQIDLLFKTFGYFIPNGETVGYAFSRAGASKINLLISKDLSQFSIIQTNVPLTQEILNYGATIIKTNNNQNKLYQGRIALLINENCFSSCELFAAALQENRKATIIGKRSGGAVLGSFTDSIIKNMVFMKKDTGWRMQIPIIDFYTVSGKRLEGVGVTPDIETNEKNSDKVLEEAVKYLQRNTINKN